MNASADKDNKPQPWWQMPSTHTLECFYSKLWVPAQILNTILTWEPQCRPEMKMLHVCVRVWVCVRVCVCCLYVCANLSVYMWPDGHKRGKKFQKALKRKTVWQRKEYNVDWVICGNPANEIPLLSTSEEPTHGSTLRLQRVQGAWLLTSRPFPDSEGEECGRGNFII